MRACVHRSECSYVYEYLYFVGINRRLLLGSTVGFCWDRPSALAVGSCWDRPSAFAGIDRKLQGELC
jgi:hypothetical protein